MLNKWHYKSLAVKSLRIGWKDGLFESLRCLGARTWKGVMYVGIFEDTFPSVDDVYEVLKRIDKEDIEYLCAYETHHRRGHTDMFYRLKDIATKKEYKDVGQAIKWLKQLNKNFYLPPRGINVLWTWYKIKPNDSGAWKREPLSYPFKGLPEEMHDIHCGGGMTRLAGIYDNHLMWSKMTDEEWEEFRKECVTGAIAIPSEPTLFPF